jgi:hypothetical protein
MQEDWLENLNFAWQLPEKKILQNSEYEVYEV